MKEKTVYAVILVSGGGEEEDPADAQCSLFSTLEKAKVYFQTEVFDWFGEDMEEYHNVSHIEFNEGGPTMSIEKYVIDEEED
tara:strand:- start:895 stop:1140 length:246 start_codon:yes stop_codon:yes gene_type:complete